MALEQGDMETYCTQPGQQTSDVIEQFGIQSYPSQFEFAAANYQGLDHVPIVRLNEAGERELTLAQWGLLPNWWKPVPGRPERSESQLQRLNARSKGIETKGSFKEAFAHRRCLMPANEYSYHGWNYHLPDFKLFAFAGMWERWGEGNDRIESCVRLAKHVSGRMRRVLVTLKNEEQYALWLNPQVTTLVQLATLIQGSTTNELLRYETAAS